MGVTAGWAARLTATLVAVADSSGCGHGRRPSATEYADQLASRVSTNALMAHLRELQTIAHGNGGNRLTGTPGYQASADYVAKTLRDNGFDVQRPEFDVGLFRVRRESLTVDGDGVTAQAVDFSGSSGPAGITGPIVAAPSDASPGCEPSDYDGLPTLGAIVVVDRGSCFLSSKAAAATQRGARALVIVNDVDERVFSGGLLEEGRGYPSRRQR